MNFETPPIALQRCDRFVARTMNWLYDHLRCVIHYRPVVLCDVLKNREEFPELQAWSLQEEHFTRRIWRRVAGARMFPSDHFRMWRLNPCVLHSHFGYVAVEDFLLHQRLGVPWFISFYGADVYELGRLTKWQEMYARAFEQATRVLALGPEMAIRLKQLGCPEEKVSIHPLGVDTEGLPSRPRVLKPGEPLKILFAGTFREKKGIQYVIEATAIARRSGMRLQLYIVGDAQGKVGDKETKEAIFQQIRCLNLENVVTHRPFLSFQELLSLALDSHVFVAPSVTAADGDAEGTPFILQQMMATGMPSISTYHSDIPFLFGEHKHMLVQERNAWEIADRLQRYFESPGTLVEDGGVLREQIRHAFDVNKCAAHLSDLYDTVC